MKTNLDDLIKQYVVCRENCSLLYIESLAMNGFVKNMYVEECDRRNFKKIVVELLNNQVITSECRFREEIEQSARIIITYIDFGRRHRSSEALKIMESKPLEE